MSEKINLDNIDDSTFGSEIDNMPDLDDNIIEDPDKKENTSEYSEEYNIYEEDEGKSASDDTEVEDDESDSESDDSYGFNDYEDNDDIETVETTDDDGTEEPIVLNVNGTKLEIDSTEDLKTLTSNALQYKNKYEAYQDDIEVIEGLKNEGIQNEDLYLLAEAKKGNKKALAKLLKSTGVDPYDIDTDDEDIDKYKPKEVRADINYIEAKNILSEIQSDKDVSTKFDNLVMKDFDQEAREAVFKSPNNLRFIAELTKTGLLEKILPEYTKNKLLGKVNNSFDGLVMAYDEYMKKENQNVSNKVKSVKDENNKKTSKRKKASVGSKSKANQKSKQKSVNDMSDEEFERLYQQKVGGYSFSV